MKYFGLGLDGNMYDLCDCGDIEAAEESAEDLCVGPMIWLADEEQALEWCDRILSSVYGITTQSIEDSGMPKLRMEFEGYDD